MACTNYRGSRRGHGALIIGVLLVLAIVLYLMFGMSTGGSGGSTSKGGGGGSTYMGQVGQTRKQGKALAQDISTQQLTLLIVQYREANNKLPKAPADLEDSAVYFKDPWGNEMTFSFESARGKTTVTYRSKGPDGEANTEDDVSKTDTLPF